MTKRLIATLISIAFLLIGVIWFTNSTEGETMEASDGKLRVVATNSIIGNMVEEVAGDAVSLHTIVPRGTDPHEYDPRPEDISKTQDSDVLFHNGLNLETGGSGWFKKMYQNAGKVENQQVFAVSENVEALPLSDASQESDLDPHAWLDIQNGIKYVQKIEEVLIDKDPKNQQLYRERADAYIAKLAELDLTAKTKFSGIPSEKRVLVTSEGAFKYFGAAYDITPVYIWELNTESQGTPEQMERVIEKIRSTSVPVLFVESSVSPKSMEKISKETGLPIYSTIYTDSLAAKGSPADSYYGMMEWNLDKIYSGLSQ